jgi:hypothetical protein
MVVISRSSGMSMHACEHLPKTVVWFYGLYQQHMMTTPCSLLPGVDGYCRIQPCMRILGGQQQAFRPAADCQCVWCWLSDDQHKADLMLLDSPIVTLVCGHRIVSRPSTLDCAS